MSGRHFLLRAAHHVTIPRFLLGYVMVARATPEDGPVVCPFRRLTGRSCPLCGLTRSIALLSRSRFRASVAQHPLGLVVATVAAVGITNDARRFVIFDRREERA